MKPGKVALLAILGVAVIASGIVIGQRLDTILPKPQPEIMVLKKTSPTIFAQDAALVPDFKVAAKRVLDSVVSIDTVVVGQDFFGRRVQSGGSGSGVIISQDGYIVTNNHVVTDRGRPVDQMVVTLSDGTSLEGTLVGRDPRADLAVIKVNKNDLNAIEIGNSQDVQIGQWVIAAGNPLGYENTISVGVVSSKGRPLQSEEDYAIFSDGIQTDAAINRGNSGGALCDANGQLIGINVAIASPDGGSIGIGFAIPVNRVKEVVDDIIKFGYAKYGRIGLSVRGSSNILAIDRYRQAIAEELNISELPPTEGVLVMEVYQNTPAATAGISPLDVITEIDGKPMNETRDYQVFMADKRPGAKLKITLWSKGKTKTVTLTLDEAENSL